MEKLTLEGIVEELKPMFPDDQYEDYNKSMVGFADYGFAYYKFDIPKDYEPVTEVEGDWQATSKLKTSRRNKWLNENTVLGACIEMDSGGGPDAGSGWWKVYHFPKHEVYMKIDGYYQSYEGLEIYESWDACFEVLPKQVMTTIYEEKPETVN